MAFGVELIVASEAPWPLGSWGRSLWRTPTHGLPRLPRGFAAALQRAHPCLPRCLPPATNRRTSDNRVCVLAIPKAEPGEHWGRLFRGDSHGARCMRPPYTLSGAGGRAGGRLATPSPGAGVGACGEALLVLGALLFNRAFRPTRALQKRRAMC